MKPEPTGISTPKSVFFYSLLLTACFVTAAVAAERAGAERAELPPPNWNRAAALQASALDQQQELHSWLQEINAGNADQVLAVQRSSPGGSQISSAIGSQVSSQVSNLGSNPAFEAQLFGLALALAEAPQDSAIDALLLWLADYSPTVLVAHEEHADYGVPLYPVAAAAMGSLAERQRQQAGALASQLLNGSPQQWIQRYLSATPVEQQGFNHSLRAATPNAVLPLATTLQQQLPQHPELAAPAGVLASLLSDPQLFLAAYHSAQGATSVSLLREANWRLDAAQRSELLAGTLALDSADKSALAISMLAPGLRSNPAVSENLLQLLDDPELGAAAALALAGHPDQRLQDRLEELLQAGGLKGQRAALALDQSAFIQPDSDPQ